MPVVGVGWCALGDGLSLLPTTSVVHYVPGVDLLLLPIVGIGWCTLGIDMLLMSRFFLVAGVY